MSCWRNCRLALGLIAAAAVTSLAQASDVSVAQAAQKFSTTELDITRGDTVHFLNHDDVTHNIMIVDANGDPEDKGLQKPGEQIVRRFDVAGRFQVRCAIHPRMKMTIGVK
jgi:plastocyanin